jgi:hypothetical protein
MASVLNYIYQIPRSLLALMPQSNAEKFQQRFGQDPAAKDVYEKYFSSYSNNHLPLDEAILTQIDQIVQRKAVGLEISSEWQRIILGNDGWAFDSTHREIPQEPLLNTALKAQFTFESHLASLERLDALRFLSHSKIKSELSLLKKEASRWSWCCLCRPQYTESEQSLLSGIRSKADHYGKSYKEQLGESIQMRQELLEEIAVRVGAIEAGIRAPQEAVWLDAQSQELQKLLRDSRQVDREEVYEPDSVHSSIKDHAVMAIGDPITDPEARFLIVKRPQKMPKEAWLAFMGAKNSSLLLAAVKKDPSVKLNESCFVHFPYKSETYSVEISMEKAGDALALHKDRDFYEKSRRKVVAPQKFERTNALEKTDAVYTIKDIWRALTSDNWSEHRVATAGPDAHEAIFVNRSVIGKILSGNWGQISRNVAQNLGEYFSALPFADVASLPESYMQDPRFKQAIRLQDLMHGDGLKLYEGGAFTELLVKESGAQFDWAKHDLRFRHLTENVFGTYDNWRHYLSQFLQQLNLPINRGVRDVLGDQLIADLTAFLGNLEGFLENAPPVEIRQVINDGRAIIQAARDRALTQPERDALANIWTVWKAGKTSKEIDRILGQTTVAIDQGLAALAENLLKLSVPFSSKKLDGEITQAIQKSNPLLNSVYTKAIPPIWQNKARLSLAKDEVLKGTEHSPTWLHALSMFANGTARATNNEFQRSVLSKAFMASRKPA